MFVFFFNDTANTEIYTYGHTLSLHDALPITPDYALGSHVAPLGLSFATGAGFPGFAQGAFVGEHGSWNSQRLPGYKVSFIPFTNGRPAGQPKDFVTSFVDDGKAPGRPEGVTLDPSRSDLWNADNRSDT